MAFARCFIFKHTNPIQTGRKGAFCNDFGIEILDHCRMLFAKELIWLKTTYLDRTIFRPLYQCNEHADLWPQNTMANCSTCNKTVQDSQLGKYCVRFGANIKQFCSNVCLDEYKKGLKVCCYCQKDISGGDGFLAPIGDKGQFKDFCAQECIQVWSLQIFYHIAAFWFLGMPSLNPPCAPLTELLRNKKTGLLPHLARRPLQTCPTKSIEWPYLFIQKYEELNCGKKIEKPVETCAVCGCEKAVDVKLILFPKDGERKVRIVLFCNEYVLCVCRITVSTSVLSTGRSGWYGWCLL